MSKPAMLTIQVLIDARETSDRGLAGGCAKRHPSKPGHQDNEAQKENIHEAPPPLMSVRP